MAQVNDTFTLLRRIDITQPTFADPDWVATQDFDGWRENGLPQWWVPNSGRGPASGWIQFLVVFEDTPSLRVPALVNTRIDLQFIAQHDFRDNASIPRLAFSGSTLQLAGDTVTDAPAALRYREFGAIRLVTIANAPTANFVDIYGRII